MPPIIPVDTTNLVVIIALPEEHDVFVEAFPSIGDVSDETHVRLRHKFDIDGFTLTSVLAEGMGADFAASAANSAIRDLQPDLLICLGIAGALSADALLGDVCVGTEIIDVLHNAKIVDAAQAGGKSQTLLSPRVYGVPTKLLASCRFLRSHPNQKEIYAALKESMKARWQAFSNAFPSNPVLEVDSEATNDFHVGPIVCGAVSASKTYNAKLKDINRKSLAIETESGGIYKAAQDNDIPAITIRGISDRADRNKAKLEGSFAGALRRLAMENATAFFKTLCRNVFFLNTARVHANVRCGGRHKAVQESKPEQILRKAEERIRAHLDAASAEFKHRPFDAPLPLPRLRRAATAEEVVIELDDHPVSIVDAIIEERRLMIKIPRSYPERNIAWYIGLSLLKAEIDGKQVLPFVFDGARVNYAETSAENAFGEAGTVRNKLLSYSPWFEIAGSPPFLPEAKWPVSSPSSASGSTGCLRPIRRKATRNPPASSIASSKKSPSARPRRTAT